jgi:ADP-ribose pyrophosphatase YjhB (NUDIX family)
VIFNQQGQVLLLKHRFRPGSGWGLPGGFLKRGEQPLDALRRELEEEIALKIENAEVFWARSFARPRQVEILFIGETQASPNPQSIEVESAVWFSADDLPTGLGQDQKLLIKRAVEKRKV